MYFFVGITKYIKVPPERLGPDMYYFINEKLNDLLGSCTIHYGYLVTIFKIEKIENGIVNQQGEALFTVSFKALVFRPIKGEVLDGIVDGIARVGIELSVGALKIFIPHTQIPDTFEFKKDQEKFESNEDTSQAIQKGSMVRFRILSISIKGNENVGEMSGIGSIDGHYLGLVNN